MAYPGRAHSGAVTNRLAATSGHSWKHAANMLKAAAELSCISQRELFERLCGYVQQMVSAGAASLSLLLHRASYDETKMRVRIQWPTSRMQTEDGKIFVVNHSFAFLLKLKIPQQSGFDIPRFSQRHLLIRGAFSASLRGSDSTAGEALASVLTSTFDTPDDMSQLAKRTLRLVESDEASSNARGEKLLRAARSHDVPLFQMYCVLHKVHTACQRTFELLPPQTLSGITRSLLTLQGSLTMANLRETLISLIPGRVVIQRGTRLPQAAKRYRSNVLSLLPQGKCTRRVCLAAVVASALLNGDWRTKGVLIHRCAGCCKDAADTVTKMQYWLPRLLSSLRFVVNKGNWLNWSDGFALFVLAHMHGLLIDVYEKTCTGQVLWQAGLGWKFGA